MEQEKKRCHFIISTKFTESLEKTHPDNAKLILETMKELEFYENNPDKLPKGTRSAELKFGKMLNKVNNTIYSLEPSHKLRALAHVTQKDGVKVYVWLWGGRHEVYNDEISAHKLNTKEKNANIKYGSEVQKEIEGMVTNLSKEKVSANIQTTRENVKGKHKHGNNKSKKL